VTVNVAFCPYPSVAPDSPVRVCVGIPVTLPTAVTTLIFPENDSRYFSSVFQRVSPSSGRIGVPKFCGLAVLGPAGITKPLSHINLK
jgi:hypothetical protein